MRNDATRVREIRRRALRSLIIMALASSPLIWVKLRLVTGIPKMAYADSAAPAPVDQTRQIALAAVDGRADW